MLYKEKKVEERGWDITTARTSLCMDSIPADTAYISHIHTHTCMHTNTHTHTPQSKSNDVIHRKRWREYRVN